MNIRCFLNISTNRRARPLLTYETVVNLIASTRTKAGLTIRAALDYHTYETGVEVSDEDFESIRLQKDPFHGEWNYTILPRDLNL